VSSPGISVKGREHGRVLEANTVTGADFFDFGNVVALVEPPKAGVRVHGS
jgi:hypothetical protein